MRPQGLEVSPVRGIVANFSPQVTSSFTTVAHADHGTSSCRLGYSLVYNKADVRDLTTYVFSAKLKNTMADPE
jgi:hypothetical protein